MKKFLHKRLRIQEGKQYNRAEDLMVENQKIKQKSIIMKMFNFFGYQEK